MRGTNPPCCQRSCGENLGFAVRPRVVLAQKVAEPAIEIRDGQFRPTANSAGLDVAGQRAQKHLIDGLEEPLDAPATARLSRRGEDQPHLDVCGDLFEVARGEIAAVIRVEDLGNAEDDPVGVRFPPDRLAQRQGSAGRRRAVEGNAKARNRATVVVDDDGQPRPSCFAVGSLGPEIELGVVGLPDLVRAFGFTPMNQVVGFAIGLLAVEGEGFEIVGDGADHVVDRVISRRRVAASARDAADFPINGAGAKRRTFQRETFGKAAKVVRHATPLALVRPAGADQPDQPKPPISADPALRRPKRQRRLLGDARERCVMFQMRTKLPVTIQGALALSLG